MQRAHGGSAVAAAAAAAATVAPLLQLTRAAERAAKRARFARALELYERALAAAELALPRDSLIIATLLDEIRLTHHDIYMQANDVSTLAGANARGAAAYNVELKLRSLLLLHARWQAGTLFVPTAEETAYLVEDVYPGLPAQMCGAFCYIRVAKDVVRLPQRFLPPCTPAVTEARLRAMYGALRAALEVGARGMLERNPSTGQAWSASSTAVGSSVMVPILKRAVFSVVTATLNEAGMLRCLRVTCGLLPAEEAALRLLAERHKSENECRSAQELSSVVQGWKVEQQHTAAADAARHGLRRCALPSCAAQEPHPKLFKLCGRCRGVAYCGAAHCAEDWKRHKREDGCAAAP
jgi:hypothetical protein